MDPHSSKVPQGTRPPCFSGGDQAKTASAAIKARHQTGSAEEYADCFVFPMHRMSSNADEACKYWFYYQGLKPQIAQAIATRDKEGPHTLGFSGLVDISIQIDT